MVKRTYIGILHPQSDFGSLRPFELKLLEMQCRCVPLSEDYQALQAVRRALHDAATHFTGNRYFYGGGPHSS